MEKFHGRLRDQKFINAIKSDLKMIFLHRFNTGTGKIKLDKALLLLGGFLKSLKKHIGSF